MGIDTTPYKIAERFIGLKEVKGPVDNPQVLAMLQLDNTWVGHDEVAWCSAFVNYVAWLLRLPRSKQLSARSWLAIGGMIPPLDAKQGFDVVVLKRGEGDQPGPEVLQAPGHVGFFGGYEGRHVWLLGGNQSDQVSLAPFLYENILGVRRLS